MSVRLSSHRMVLFAVPDEAVEKGSFNIAPVMCVQQDRMAASVVQLAARTTSRTTIVWIALDVENLRLTILPL